MRSFTLLWKYPSGHTAAVKLRSDMLTPREALDDYLRGLVESPAIDGYRLHPQLPTATITYVRTTSTARVACGYYTEADHQARTYLARTLTQGPAPTA